MVLILFGFKNSGKTYFGKLFSEYSHLTFIDLDQLIERHYLEHFKEPLSCRKIAITHGEFFFRQLEKETLFTLENCKNCLISLGGGTVLDPQNLAFILNLGTLVYLLLDKQTLKERTLKDEHPSYLNPSDPENSFEMHYEIRKTHYEKIPSIHLNLEGKTDAKILEELKQILSNGKQ